MTRQHILKSVKKIQIKVSNYLKKRHTIAGKIIWAFNCILLVFFILFILKILLEPFGYLNEFIVAIIGVAQLVIGFISYPKIIKFRSFLEEKSILQHIIFSSILITIYYLSIKQLWENKEIYLKLHQH